MTTPDFYTIGYSGRTIEPFIATLHDAGVKTLVDVRHLPLSRHKPDFSKTRLAAHLERSSIAYHHVPALGVPRAMRDKAKASGELGDLWIWYDEEVDSPAREYKYYGILDARHPFALMCMEADPLTCHRHRLALALERVGLRGVDL